MAAAPQPSLLDQSIVLCSLTAIGLLMSVFRLFDRARTGRFSWDDIWCAISACFLIVAVVSDTIVLWQPEGLSQLARVAAYYTDVLSFYCTVYTARISLVCFLIRITASRPFFKCWLCLLAATFGMILIALLVDTLWTCEVNPGWKLDDPPLCIYRPSMGIILLSFDAVADLLLAIIPVYLICKSSLEKRVRLRLCLIFATSLFLAAASVVHDVLMYVEAVGNLFAAGFESNVALIVCSFPVVSTSLYRMYSRTKEDFDVDTDRRHASPAEAAELSTTLAACTQDPVRSWTTMSSGPLSRHRASQYNPRSDAERSTPRSLGHAAI